MPENAIDAVLTHREDGFRSGVARFNEMLATALGVRLLALSADDVGAARRPLISLKVSELDEAGRAALAAVVSRPGVVWEVFLHELADDPLERRLIAGAERVHAGNHEIARLIAGTRPGVRTLWTPGLLRDDRALGGGDVSVFSFGMAHKLRLDMFQQLRRLLDGSDRPYVVYVSAANHETVSLRDSQAVFAELHEIFPTELFFLGNLSDVAVNHYLRTTTYFSAFFPRGARANNTSVASAMERGAVVLTNLDGDAPPELVHMENVVDITCCEELPTDPAVLCGLRRAAVETSRLRSWGALVAALRSE